MKSEYITYFPGKAPRQIRERYCMEKGVMVGKYESFYKNGQVKVEKEFDEHGKRIKFLRYRPDGTRLTKLGIEEGPEKEVTLTSEELATAIQTYEQLRKKALEILRSRKIDISLRATDKSLLKQFKQFEENRFSF